MRLNGGRAESLLGVGNISKLRITVDFGKRNFHDGQGGWKVMTRNGENRRAMPLSPTAREYAKLAVFREDGN